MEAVANIVFSPAQLYQVVAGDAHNSGGRCCSDTHGSGGLRINHGDCDNGNHPDSSPCVPLGFLCHRHGQPAVTFSQLAAILFSSATGSQVFAHNVSSVEDEAVLPPAFELDRLLPPRRADVFIHLLISAMNAHKLACSLMTPNEPLESLLAAADNADDTLAGDAPRTESPSQSGLIADTFGKHGGVADTDTTRPQQHDTTLRKRTRSQSSSSFSSSAAADPRQHQTRQLKRRKAEPVRERRTSARRHEPRHHKSRSKIRTVSEIEDWMLDCHCARSLARAPAQCPVIQCEVCDTWAHLPCVRDLLSVPAADADEAVRYTCPSCADEDGGNASRRSARKRRPLVPLNFGRESASPPPPAAADTKVVAPTPSPVPPPAAAASPLKSEPAPPSELERVPTHTVSPDAVSVEMEVAAIMAGWGGTQPQAPPPALSVCQPIASSPQSKDGHYERPVLPPLTAITLPPPISSPLPPVPRAAPEFRSAQHQFTHGPPPDAAPRLPSPAMILRQQPQPQPQPLHPVAHPVAVPHLRMPHRPVRRTITASITPQSSLYKRLGSAEPRELMPSKAELDQRHRPHAQQPSAPAPAPPPAHPKASLPPPYAPFPVPALPPLSSYPQPAAAGSRPPSRSYANHSPPPAAGGSSPYYAPPSTQRYREAPPPPSREKGYAAAAPSPAESGRRVVTPPGNGHPSQKTRAQQWQDRRPVSAIGLPVPHRHSRAPHHPPSSHPYPPPSRMVNGHTGNTSRHLPSASLPRPGSTGPQRSAPEQYLPSTPAKTVTLPPLRNLTTPPLSAGHSQWPSSPHAPVIPPLVSGPKHAVHPDVPTLPPISQLTSLSPGHLPAAAMRYAAPPPAPLRTGSAHSFHPSPMSSPSHHSIAPALEPHSERWYHPPPPPQQQQYHSRPQQRGQYNIT
ncbi:hypothetical protein RI367_005536 [Sorochytrium milnesiophthora]